MEFAKQFDLEGGGLRPICLIALNAYDFWTVGS